MKAGRFVRNNLLKVANENGQNNYVALHARVENDWREHCIHMERLWGFEIEMWTPPSLILKRMNKVKLFQDIKVLYISVNIQTYDEHENGNIFEIFSKHTSQKEQHYLPYKLSNFTDKYNIGEMPYLLRSAVDFIICTESSAFVGNFQHFLNMFQSIIRNFINQVLYIIFVTQTEYIYEQIMDC